ncbi:MAG TPA: heme exporter protein CcmD [Sphingomonas sp.]
MNHWLFVAAAYGITFGATVALLGWSYAAMRAAERDPK